MHIETYIIEETANLIYDGEALDEWLKLTESLGLKAQEEICKEKKSPIPFLPMNTRITNILEELLPTTVDIKDYKLTPIPLEVLKLVSLSVTERYFGDIKIMYDETSKDPACIGVTAGWFVDNSSGSRQAHLGAFLTKEECEAYIKEKNLEGHKPYKYGGKKYLIARWADVKQTWEELAERATKRFISTETAGLEKEIIEKKAKLENIRNEAVLKFS